jgi:hypothetical protein
LSEADSEDKRYKRETTHELGEFQDTTLLFRAVSPSRKPTLRSHEVVVEIPFIHKEYARENACRSEELGLARTSVARRWREPAVASEKPVPNPRAARPDLFLRRLLPA